MGVKKKIRPRATHGIKLPTGKLYLGWDWLSLILFGGLRLPMDLAGRIRPTTRMFRTAAWFFYSCVLGFIVMAVLVTIVVKKWFVEVSFEEEGEET